MFEVILVLAPLLAANLLGGPSGPHEDRTSVLLWVPGAHVASRLPATRSLTPLQHLRDEAVLSETEPDVTLEPEAFADLLREALGSAAFDEGDARIDFLPNGRVHVHGSPEVVDRARRFTAFLEDLLLDATELTVDVYRVRPGTLDEAPSGARPESDVGTWLTELRDNGDILSEQRLTGPVHSTRWSDLGGAEEHSFVKTMNVEIACGGVQFHPTIGAYELGVGAAATVAATDRGHLVDLFLRIDDPLANATGLVGFHRRTRAGHRGTWITGDFQVDLERPSIAFWRLGLSSFLERDQVHVTCLSQGAAGRDADRVIVLSVRDSESTRSIDLGAMRFAWRALPRDHARTNVVLPDADFLRGAFDGTAPSYALAARTGEEDVVDRMRSLVGEAGLVEPLAGGLAFLGPPEAIQRALEAWDAELAQQPMTRTFQLSLAGGDQESLRLATSCRTGSQIALAHGVQTWMRLGDWAEIGCSTAALQSDLGPVTNGAFFHIEALPEEPGRPATFQLDGIATLQTGASRELHPVRNSPILLDGWSALTSHVHEFVRLKTGEARAFGRDARTPGAVLTGAFELR